MVKSCISSCDCRVKTNKIMGLVYNNKNKLDLVVLSEEKLENNEGELCDFVIMPDGQMPDDNEEETPKP